MQIQGRMVYVERLASGYAQIHVDCGDGAGPIIGVVVPALVLVRDGVPELGQRLEIAVAELTDDQNSPSERKPTWAAVGLSGCDEDGGMLPRWDAGAIATFPEMIRVRRTASASAE